MRKRERSLLTLPVVEDDDEHDIYGYDLVDSNEKRKTDDFAHGAVAPKDLKSTTAATRRQGSKTTVRQGNATATTSQMSKLQSLADFVVKQYLPIVLTAAVVLGLTVPSVGKNLAEIKIGNLCSVQTVKVCVCYIFFVQGLLLKTDEVKKACAAVWPVLYGISTILFITPLVSIPVNLLGFLQHDLRIGLVVFCNMASTMSAGVQLAGASGGNFAFALLLSVVTNILSIFTVPFYLSMLMSQSGMQIDPFPMLRDLLSTILLPLSLGKTVSIGYWVMGRQKSFAASLTKEKTKLMISVNTAQALVPLVKMSQSAEAIARIGFGSVFVVVVVAVCVHLAFLVWNFYFTGLLRYRLDFRKSLLLMCSQKNSVLAMAVLSFLPASVGNQGTMAISCILGTFSQLIIDAFLVGFLASWTLEGKPTRFEQIDEFLFGEPPPQSPLRRSPSLRSLLEAIGLFDNGVKNVNNSCLYDAKCEDKRVFQKGLIEPLPDTPTELAQAAAQLKGDAGFSGIVQYVDAHADALFGTVTSRIDEAFGSLDSRFKANLSSNKENIDSQKLGTKLWIV